MTVTIDEPIELFRSWLKEAEDAEPINPNAMTLATVDAEGRPSARMVLLKDVDEKGFVFYTNLASRKADDLGVNLNAALCFYWKTLAKQVRVEGAVAPVSDVEADEYFASRAKLSQLGAWASKQSQPLEGRMALEKRVARYTAKFNIGTVPRPEFWSGFRIAPIRIEFWKEEAFRLHDRTVYLRDGEGWTTEKLYP
ncbi:MAG: pyridoxamine 5'-phosphate oxidase [Rhodospirillaceae bacterium]|jgi:pyridoxamine 5'-phosphate oxidase|nr:pyridoxamine 5'-phosphate oxidase [Rhodospirillaceae bacterium]MBT3909636.1 pyridoxamine 5'-phosphate oxidase [Rhodospirillaceae bacterium]MBT5300480.1 pyridoxamine 5'-phosphate oxidase [Rhodospirillaceae bacterium]MBT5514161.1 pyridoxamine 5'-phosphate oxidase [Rhodospirillaceae bacterium]MBT7249440.1 pyridoxamine 5'-phosphate oxidase [Rhodospirillaceae bacterium]